MPAGRHAAPAPAWPGGAAVLLDAEPGRTRRARLRRVGTSTGRVTDSALLQAKLAADARARVFAGFDPSGRPAAGLADAGRDAGRRPGGQVGYALDGGLRLARTSAWFRLTGPRGAGGGQDIPLSPGSDA